MANIATLLNRIKTAVYGEDVRGSIHDAIEAINIESEEAKTAAIEAQDSAQASAATAGSSKTAAEEAQSAAEQARALAQNWAEGPNGGSVAPTDTNNAEYWCERAEAAVNALSGAVQSFNGRKGLVVPESGDYTHNMVGAVEETDDGYLKTTKGGQKIAFGVDSNGNYGYIKAGADTVTPFKNPQGTININQNGTIDVEDYKTANVAVPSEVPVGNIDFGTITTNGAKTGYNVSGKATASFTVSVPNTNTETYTFPSGSNGSIVDLGVNNAYRYANAQNVFNAGKAAGTPYVTGSTHFSDPFELLTGTSFSATAGRYYMFFGNGLTSIYATSGASEIARHSDYGILLLATASTIYFSEDMQGKLFAYCEIALGVQ